VLEAQARKAAAAAADSSHAADAAELKAAGLNQALVGKQRVRQLLRSLFDHERAAQKLSSSACIDPSLEQQYVAVCHSVCSTPYAVLLCFQACSCAGRRHTWSCLRRAWFGRCGKRQHSLAQ
jgi:hypothetical protein